MKLLRKKKLTISHSPAILSKPCAEKSIATIIHASRKKNFFAPPRYNDVLEKYICFLLFKVLDMDLIILIKEFERIE